jgi:hypothetical protein
MTLAMVEWTYQPWRETPGRATLALGFTVLAAVLLHQVGGSLLLTVLLTLAVAVQLAALLIPTRCRMDATGIMARGILGWERRTWSGIRRVGIGPSGVLVSPFATARRLDRFRALVLPLPRQRRDDLVAAVRTILAEHALA